MSTWDDIIAATILDIACQDTGASAALTGSGTLIGGDTAATLTVVDGPTWYLPRSLDLDGTNDYIRSASTTDVIGTNWTIGVWVKVDTGQSQSLANDNYLFGSVNGGVSFSWSHTNAAYRGVASGRLAAGTYVATSGAPLTHTADQWDHYAAQWSGTTLYTGKNGVRVGSVAMASIQAGANRVDFGGLNGTGILAGRICGCRIITGSSEELLAALYAGPPEPSTDVYEQAFKRPIVCPLIQPLKTPLKL